LTQSSKRDMYASLIAFSVMLLVRVFVSCVSVLFCACCSCCSVFAYCVVCVLF
jgi:hypothetical protein